MSADSGRTKNIIYNAGVSLLMKGSNIICSFLLVPLTIDYVNPERYGIWLTISSIVGWILFFDLGLGNGFRNHFVKARAAGDVELCRRYVSTAYCAITLIVLVVWGISLIINNALYWPGFLKVSDCYARELKTVFMLVCTFTSLNMIVNVFTSLLTADMRPGLASAIGAVGQWLVVAVIVIMKRFTEGSLVTLSLVLVGLPCVMMLVSSLWMFLFTRYRMYRPTLKFFSRPLLRDIMGLGMKFFTIYLCLLVVFQIVNLVISRDIGSLAVTQYNIANKFFSVPYMVVSIIMVPIWSSVTDAYTKQDFPWLRTLVRRLDIVFLCSTAVSVLMIFAAPLAYRLWIGDKVEIPQALSLTMTCYIILQVLGTIYLNVVNGFGTIRLQLILYIISAVVAWPLFTWSAREFGLPGIVLVPGLVCLVQGVAARIQVHKIINRTADGIWLKQ